MDSYTYFKEGLKRAVDEFRKLDKKETIRIVSHLDCDGISSSAILIRALQHEHRNYTVSIVQQLNEKAMRELNAENFKYFFFTDLGSSQVSLVESIFKGKKVFVLDHHELDPKDKISQRVISAKHDAEQALKAITAYEHVVHVNPVLFGVDGGREICGAGITYLFARILNPVNKASAHIAVIGAIGEVQEHNGFLSLNNEILQDALATGTITVKRGLRFFGMQTRPLHKVLEYSNDPYIPGVTGSESSAIQWLHHIGIDPKNGKDWKRGMHLSEEDMAKLSSAIILQRMQDNHENPEDIFGNVYLLAHEKEGSPFKDAKEFATLLNSCGRMQKASLGIGALLGEQKAKKAALDNLAAYRKELLKALNWYKEAQGSRNLVKGNGYIIINAQDNILSTVTGTLASIIAKSNELREGTVIVSMARTQEQTIKISTRIAGNKRDYPIDLSAIISAIIAKIEGASSGGHYQAAGAVIPCAQETLFIAQAQDVLDTMLPAMVQKLSVRTT
ncbi:DHH family phosphoesterase [Candidatus Woesearchaeota archaeon]|nr:DHH family phosphoesterase [Candidatus Woesearchaeota archaeon]